MGTMSQNEEPNVDPRISVYNIGRGEFITHFWDEETGTEATAYYFTEIWWDRPFEEHIAHRTRRSTEEEVRKSFDNIFDHHEIVEFLGVTDANRRAVPTSKIHGAVSSQGVVSQLHQLIDLRLLTETEVDFLCDALQRGVIERSTRRELRSVRDLKGRWKELQAVDIYITAKSWLMDPAPAQVVQQRMGLDNITQARNLIQRAREHKYIARSSSQPDLLILDVAFEVSRELRRLFDEAKGAMSSD